MEGVVRDTRVASVCPHREVSRAGESKGMNGRVTLTGLLAAAVLAGWYWFGASKPPTGTTLLNSYSADGQFWISLRHVTGQGFVGNSENIQVWLFEREQSLFKGETASMIYAVTGGRDIRFQVAWQDDRSATVSYNKPEYRTSHVLGVNPPGVLVKIRELDVRNKVVRALMN